MSQISKNAGPRPSLNSIPSREIPREVSARITFLRFPLVLMIIILHSNLSPCLYQWGPVGPTSFGYAARVLSLFFSDTLARVAVPLFFMFAGFLFFGNPQFSWDKYGHKIGSRCRTLIIPYFLWNGSLMALLGFIQSQPTLAVFLSGQGKSLIHYTSLEFLDAFFAFHRDSPISYHLWFLRDLMFMVLFSPCFWVLAKRATSTAFVSLALLWLMGGEIGFLNLRSEGLFFFYCGILLALHKDHLLWPDRYGKFFIGLYFPLAVLSAALTASSPSNFLFLSHPVQQGIKAIGIVAFWCLAGRAKEGKIGVLMKGLSGFSFFVYASHEPVLTITKKLLYWWNPPAGSLQALSYYFLAPLVVVILTLHLGLILEKYAPTFFGILNGQRFSRKVRAGRCFDGGSKNWFRRDEKVDSFGQSEKAI